MLQSLQHLQLIDQLLPEQFQNLLQLLPLQIIQNSKLEQLLISQYQLQQQLFQLIQL